MKKSYHVYADAGGRKIIMTFTNKRHLKNYFKEISGLIIEKIEIWEYKKTISLKDL